MEKQTDKDNADLLLFKDSKGKERLFCNTEFKALKFSEEENKKSLKVPIVVVGKYKHPKYGEVDFSQEVIDQLRENFIGKVIGFEPPVFLGHPIDTISSEANPAIGFVENVIQEDDVFWAEAEAVDDEIYEDIKKGKYRYSSAEIVREYPSKYEDKMLGPALIGLAVTNRPFIPNMPRLQTYSETQTCTDNLTIKQFNLVNGSNVENNTENTNKLMTQTAPIEVTENSPEQTDLANKFLSLAKQVEEARAKADLAEAKLKEIERQNTLSTVDSFSLSQAVKDEFKAVFSQGSFSDEQTKTVLNALQKLSDENKSEFFVQHGKQETQPETFKDRQEVQEFSESPYKNIIEANRKIAEAKRIK